MKLNMEDTKSFSRSNLMAFIIFAGSGTVPYTIPFICNFAGRTALIILPLSVLLLIPFAVWIMYLGRYFPKGTIFDLLETSMGKPVSKILVLSFICINIILAAFLLNLFAGLVKGYFLPFTPSWVVILFITTIGSIFALSEVKTFGFFVEINFIIFILSWFGGNIITVLKYFKIEHILPITEASFPGFATGLLIFLGQCSESFLFFMIAAGSIHQPDKHLRWVVKGFVQASFLALSVYIVEVLPMGPQLLGGIAYSGINTTSLIEVGEFIRGFEIFMLLVQQILSVVRISIYLYCIRISLNNLIKSRIPRFRMLLASILILLIACYINSSNSGFYYSMKFETYILLPYLILVILLASVGIAVKKKG